MASMRTSILPSIILGGARRLRGGSANTAVVQLCRLTAMRPRSQAFIRGWTFEGSSRNGGSRRTPPLPWLKPAVFTGSLAPIGAIALRAWWDELGPNPIAQALNQLGLVGLIFLIAALGCSPLKTVTGWTWQMRIRRMLGLFAFFYALLHVITYTAIDQGLDWHAIADDIIKRKFIFVGFSTFVLLLPLAVTSTDS